jgi:hypothetical protein
MMNQPGNGDNSGPPNHQFRQVQNNNDEIPQGYNGPHVGHHNSNGMYAMPIETKKDFDISYKSEVNGQMYEGRFTTKKLSILDYGRLDVETVKLNGGFYFDPDKPGVGISEGTNNLNAMIAHLKIALIRCPIWWDLDNLYDFDLLSAVYEHVNEFEDKFFRARREATEPGRRLSDDSSPAGEKSRSVGRVEEVGRGQVQDTLDP